MPFNFKHRNYFVLKKIFVICLLSLTMSLGLANPLERLHQATVAKATKDLEKKNVEQISRSLDLWVLASGLDSLGRHKEAIEAVELATKANPVDQDLQVTYAKILRQTGRLDEGLSVIKKITNPLREKAAKSNSQQEAMVLVLGDKAELFLAETHLHIAKQDWAEAIAALGFAHDVRDATNFYPYRNLWYLTLKAKSGISNDAFERSINPTKTSNTHYGKILQFWFSEGSLEDALVAANKKSRDTDRQDAVAEVLFFAAMKEKFASKNQPEADKFFNQLATLKPYGNTEWSLVESMSK